MVGLRRVHSHGLLAAGLLGEVALAAGVTVVVSSEEVASTAALGRALTAETVDLAVVVDLVVLEDGELDLLVLVRDLLGRGVVLLLAFLATTAQAEHEVQRALLLDVVVGEGAAVLELLAGEDEALLVRGDALLVLDLGLYVLDAVAGLDLKGDGLARKGLHEDLHLQGEREREERGRQSSSKFKVCPSLKLLAPAFLTHLSVLMLGGHMLYLHQLILAHTCEGAC